jgi:serine O-acetyltransferase
VTVSLSSILQTALALVALAVSALLLATILTAAVIAGARLARHSLHDELATYLRRAGQPTGFLHEVALVLLIGGPRALFIYRLARMVRPLRLAPLPFVLRQLNKWLNLCEIHPDVEFGPGLQIFHGHGILVCAGVKVGRNAWLFPNVSIGSSWGKVPVLGDNAILFEGARVFGDVRVGNNCVLSNNVIVLKDVPDNSVVALKDPVVVQRRPESWKPGVMPPSQS